MEVDAGFPSQGETEGIGIQGKVFQGWTTKRGKWLSPRVKCSRNEEYHKGQVRKGEWQTEVVLVIPEMEWNASRGIADVAQIHPKRNRKELTRKTRSYLTGAEVRAPGMAPALLSKAFQSAKLYGKQDRFDICDR